MKRTTTKLLVLTFAGLMAATTMTGCKPKRDYTNLGEGGHTYCTYLSTKPKTWNVHTWETNDESYVPAFCEMGLYDLAFNETKDGYVVIHEMAADFPKDVTKDIDEDEYDRYGYEGNIKSGLVWEIKLNPNAKFADGKVINADTYVESMKRQLSPKLVNFRADSYYASTLKLANAEDYFKQGRDTIEPVLNHWNIDTGELDPGTGDDGKYYLNIAQGNEYAAQIFSGDTSDTGFYEVLNNRSSTASDAIELAAQRITDACQYYCWQYMDHEGEYASNWEEITEYKKLGNHKKEMMNFTIDIDNFDYDEVLVRKVKDDSSEENTEVYSSEKLRKDLTTFCSAMKSNVNRNWVWKMPLLVNYYNDISVDWENVGIAKMDEYTIRLYLKQEVSELDLEFSLTGNWIVDVELYDKLMINGGSATKYASPAGGVKGYNSYGPYKLEAFESGKYFYMSKNSNWYGWTDGEHVGQFSTDAIYTTIIQDHKTALQEFLKGNIDDIELNRQDMKTYGNSKRKTSTYESYTQKLSFNSDFATLKKRQGAGANGNKTILANTKFRQALSLAMDRNNFAAEATSGSKAFTGLLNDLYLTDVEKGEMYRNTAEGKSVYNMVYGELGGDPFANNYEVQALSEDENGYNIAMATKIMSEALAEDVEKGLADTSAGYIKKNDKIDIEFRVYDTESESTIEAVDFIKKQFKAVIDRVNAKDNTSYSINITSKKDEDYYNSAKKGDYDMIFSIWGGAAINPVGLMQVYCDSTFDSCCEYGFKGKQDKVNLQIDMNEDGVISSDEVKSFEGWWSYINGIAETGDHDSAEFIKNHKIILKVLSHLEAGILNRWEAIPLVARASTSLNSFKIENGSKVYINLMGYGGIRYLTYNYDDVEWKAFTKEAGAALADMYK